MSNRSVRKSNVQRTLYSRFKFVENSTNVTIVNQYKYVYKNPDDNFIRLIGAVGDEGAHAIMEMLNGDAINTAADTIGIHTNSIADIFQRVLDNKYDDYIKSGEILNVIKNVRAMLPDLPRHPMNKSHSVTKLTVLKSKIKSGTITLNQIKYYSGAFEEMVNELHRESVVKLEESGKSISRVIDNAKEGMCQICCMPLDSIDTFIVKCCGIILCADCGVLGTNLKQGYDRKENKNAVVGSCANCKAAINMQRDFIFLDKDFSIESIISAKGTETAPKIAPVEIVTDSEIKNPKLRALLSIIKGEYIADKIPCDIKIERLLSGVRDIPAVGKKVVVFASFNETLQLIENFLCEQGIDYLRLKGNNNEMAETIKLFRTTANVLLINSSHHCAGINIEFCDHMVLFHHIMDSNVIGQVVARGQRMMRKSNLQLHFLQYKNEEYITGKH